MRNGWAGRMHKRRETFLFAGEHVYSVDSQLNSLHLKKQNLMNRGIGYLILVTANTSGFTQEQGQNLKLPLRKAGRWSLGRRRESRWFSAGGTTSLGFQASSVHSKASLC